jgi:hypothetical protein
LVRTTILPAAEDTTFTTSPGQKGGPAGSPSEIRKALRQTSDTATQTTPPLDPDGPDTLHHGTEIE